MSKKITTFAPQFQNNTIMRGWITTIFFCSALFVNAHATVLDSLLNVFSYEIDHSADYIAIREARIDSLSHIQPQTPAVRLALANEYHSYQSDSARAYLVSIAKEPSPYDIEAAIGLVQLYAAIGRYADGIAILSQVTDVLPSHRLRWFEAVRRLYAEGALWTTVPSLQQEWQKEAARYSDSLKYAWAQNPHNNPELALLLAQYTAMDNGNIEAALKYNKILLSTIDSTSHAYAIKAYERAVLYEQAGDETSRREWLVRSAIQDVRCAVTDNGSSWLVAKDCYEDGDLSRAYKYSDYSLTNASFFNAPTRFNQTYTLGHNIANDYERLLNDSSMRLTFALITLVFMLLIVILIIIYTLKNNKRLFLLNQEMQQINKKLEQTNRKLKEANLVKEQYICRYLEVYSDNIRRLAAMARKAGEKEPSAFMSREMAHFYRSFDDTFLSLYGTFVQDFNALLKPEARLTPKKGERMTVEMRIFALILLGIDNSAKIAELLCYSPNTISNYRVKMKNNALGEREDFEHKVRTIGAL